MKKISILSLVVTVLALSSCKDNDAVNPKAELGSATITGTLYAELDNTTDGYEVVPSTKIVARIYSGDLVTNPSNDINYGYQYVETTTDATGKYSVVVPVNKNSNDISIDLIPQDFKHDVKTSPTTVEPDQIFKGNSADDNVYVYNGGTFILDLAY